MTNLISVDGLTLLYGYRKALDRLSFQVESGAMVLALGHNGAGKSTLLKILATLIHFQEGQVSLFGKSVLKDAVAIRARIGYLSHEPQIYLGLTALENLQFAARLNGLRLREKDLLACIENVGLAPVAFQAARSFSRGMLQRLAWARTLLHDPELLLLDEPFTGLDTGARHFVLRDLQRLKAEGKTIFLTTHQIEEVFPMASKVLLLQRGCMVLLSDAAELSLEQTLHILKDKSR